TSAPPTATPIFIHAGKFPSSTATSRTANGATGKTCANGSTPTSSGRASRGASSPTPSPTADPPLERGSTVFSNLIDKINAATPFVLSARPQIHVDGNALRATPWGTEITPQSMHVAREAMALLALQDVQDGPFDWWRVRDGTLVWRGSMY